MDLLEKFNAVAVKAGNRISEADKDYCERHQAAYESAITSYAELLRVSLQLDETQKELLGVNGSACKRAYMLSERDVYVNEYSVKQHLENLHERFIGNIVRYFCDTYAISIADWSIQRALREQGEGTEPNTEANEPAQRTPVKYEDVVDLIFKEMDGRSFEEYAMYQLKKECKDALGINGGWYERRKGVICFRDSFCYASTRYPNSYREVTEWELTNRGKAIVKALAHFETGKFADYPGPTERLAIEGKSGTDLLGFYGCEKLEEMKMYKNGRLDIRFGSPALATEFDETYLRKAA